jgi:acetylornithine deacetylase/succinyl-diaminopimelate desuccinylase-like protein
VNAYEYAASKRDDFLEELKELISMKSISAIPKFAFETASTAQWLAEHFMKIGMTRTKLVRSGGHPIVFAEWMGAPGAPTLLIYGHYDVQPPYNDMEKKDPPWDTDPFTPTIKDGNLYARGSSDDKGQIFAHIKAVESILGAEGKLPLNVKFLIEGEEEYTLVNTDKFVRENAALLKADFCVISDSAVLDTHRPVIVYALRGLMYMQVDLQIAKADLHSGAYGGVVRNAGQAIAEILAALHNPDGSVNVPGFYDGIQPLTQLERDAVNKIPWTDQELTHQAGTLSEQGEQGYTRRERVGLRPTLEVNGLSSGFIGEGPKTVLPSKAMAKISCRLVEGQDPDHIYDLVKSQIEKLAPAGAKLTFAKLGGGFPAKMEIDSPEMKAAIAAYKRGFEAEPVFLPEGGSIPIVATIRGVLNNLPVLLIGFGLPDDNLHAPNEKFKLDHFYRGIDTSITLIHELGAGK